MSTTTQSAYSILGYSAASFKLLNYFLHFPQLSQSSTSPGPLFVSFAPSVQFYRQATARYALNCARDILLCRRQIKIGQVLNPYVNESYYEANSNQFVVVVQVIVGCCLRIVRLV